MLRKCLVLLTATLWALAPVSQAQVWSPEKQNLAAVRLGALAGEKSGQAPGISAAVSINGKTVFAKGAGFAVPGTPATEDTLYAIASVSKQFTAATMLAMIEKMGAGKFSLQTKVKDVLPDSFPFSKSGEETLRHALNMQTGYTEYTSPPSAAANIPDGFAPITRERLRGFVYSLMRQFPATVPPGTGFSYRNTNYYLVSLMIETLGGFGDYRDAVRSFVFKPAGMTRSGFLDDYPKNAVFALPPYDTSKSAVNKPAWPRGAGEVVSNVVDMVKWHTAIMNGTLMSKSSQNAMFVPPKGSGYGMGWFTVVNPPFAWMSHGGKIAGYSPFSGIYINGQTKAWVSVAALANNDGVPVDKLSICLAQLAMDPSPTLKGLNALTKAFCGVSDKAL